MSDLLVAKLNIVSVCVQILCLGFNIYELAIVGYRTAAMIWQNTLRRRFVLARRVAEGGNSRR